MKRQMLIRLRRDRRTGIAWVENGRTGAGHSCHPNISDTGNVAGMKRLGYWGRRDRAVRCHGFYYNVSQLVVTDKYDELARKHCRCGGNHGE
jgi:hypothetical protein